MGRIQDKVAIVTGAGSGIGRATSLLFAREGAKVVVTDIDEAAVAGVAREIAAAGGEAIAHRLDVRLEQDWEAAVARTTGRFGRLDVLVNNAGIGTNKPLLQMSLADWRAVLSINLDSVFLGTRIAAEAMRDRESRRRDSDGSIVNVSSILGLVGLPDCAAYSASKGAVRLFTKAAALESAANGWKVRVNSVHPGFIWTPLMEGGLKSLAESASANIEDVTASIAAMHPVNRFGRAEEVAAGILFLASDESAFMTGAELVLDGGYTAR